MTISRRYRRHLMWATLAFGFLFVNFFRNSTAVLSGDLAAVFDATASELGLLHSSFFYVYAAAQLPSGLLVDRYGSRRVVSVGLVGMAAGVAGFAAADSFAVGFLARFLAGLSGASIYVAVLRFCANWYAPEEFATMTGFTIAAAGIGGVLATTPLAVAAEAAGWRAVLYAAAGECSSPGSASACSSATGRRIRTTVPRGPTPERTPTRFGRCWRARGASSATSTPGSWA